MKKKKAIITLSAFAVSAIALTLTLVNAPRLNGHLVHATECEHAGNHYERKDATTTESGHKEFWACCKCNQQFLEQPAEGTFVDAPDSAMIGGLDDTHIAYIPQITTTLSELNVICYEKFVTSEQSAALKSGFEQFLNDNGTQITTLTWVLDQTGGVSEMNGTISNYNTAHPDAKIDVILGGKAWSGCTYINDNYTSVKDGSSVIYMTIGSKTDRAVWTLNDTDNLAAVKKLVKYTLDWDM